jgi:hypothetical protein
MAVQMLVAGKGRLRKGRGGVARAIAECVKGERGVEVRALEARWSEEELEMFRAAA